jgi:hypothetical protein
MTRELLKIQNNVTLVVTSRISEDGLARYAYPRWRDAYWFYWKLSVISFIPRTIKKIWKRFWNILNYFSKWEKRNFYCPFPLRILHKIITSQNSKRNRSYQSLYNMGYKNLSLFVLKKKPREFVWCNIIVMVTRKRTTTMESSQGNA